MSTKNISESVIFDSYSIDFLYECNKDILNNHREAILLHKIQAETMEIYVDNMKYLFKRQIIHNSTLLASLFIILPLLLQPTMIDFLFF